VFGCQAVVWTPKEQRTSKAAPVGQRMIHIRRDERAKGYMFYNPKSRKTVISRDAQFLENTPAYSEIASRGTPAQAPHFQKLPLHSPDASLRKRQMG